MIRQMIIWTVDHTDGDLHNDQTVGKLHNDQTDNDETYFDIYIYR